MLRSLYELIVMIGEKEVKKYTVAETLADLDVSAEPWAKKQDCKLLSARVVATESRWIECEEN